MDLSGFHVITVVSNPIRYKSRYELYRIFDEDIRRKGAQLWTMEMQTGARLPKITSAGDARHIQLWNSALPGEAWHKEALINIGIQQLTIRAPNWRYVAWVDADVKFEQGSLEETAQALQHWDLVQMWSHATDLGPNRETVGTHESFMYLYWTGKKPSNQPSNQHPNQYHAQGHPGYGWAARRDALNKLGTSVSGGPILDFGILGSSDRHMACALVGRVMESVHGDCHPNYHKWLRLWQQRSESTIRRNVGYVPGTIRHMWHGKKSARGYGSRWRILVKNQFDPEQDIKRDVSGLWQLISETPRQLGLRDDIRKYFRGRNEDSVDVF
jgi:hypothetical protein